MIYQLYQKNTSFKLQKEFDFICSTLNKLSYHTKNEAYSS